MLFEKGNNISWPIQIQHLLKLNSKQNIILVQMLDSNTTLVKVKSPLVSIFAVSSAFKYNTC